MATFSADSQDLSAAEQLHSKAIQGASSSHKRSKKDECSATPDCFHQGDSDVSGSCTDQYVNIPENRDDGNLEIATKNVLSLNCSKDDHNSKLLSTSYESNQSSESHGGHPGLKGRVTQRWLREKLAT